jgi:ribosomal protein S18 acetylase RimI-like enzyme
MAAFTAKDPMDREAFMSKWTGILADGTITKQTILFDEHVAGNVVSFVAPWSGKREVSYWIGRAFWGKGIATKALSQLLSHLKARPLYARAAKDNIASIRVLKKCGFTITGFEKGFANARGEEIEEAILELGDRVQSAAELDLVAGLSNAEREEVRLLSLAVYPAEQLANWPGRHIEWSTPEWCVRIRNEGNDLVSYVGAYLRDAEVDGRHVRIAGIGNVKTHPMARRQGLAATGITRAIEFFHEQPDVEFALLVCEPVLLGYYSGLGWQPFEGRLLVQQYGADAEFTFNQVMTRAVRLEGPVSGTINLCGPPW